MAWLLESHRCSLPSCWMLLILVLTKPMWESSTGHFDIFWALPYPEVSCLWGCQNSFSCSAHNLTPERSAFLLGQLQRISPTEVQSHCETVQRQFFSPFFIIQSTQASANSWIKALRISVEIDFRVSAACGNLVFIGVDFSWLIVSWEVIILFFPAIQRSLEYL